jgi:hypothetical protein
MIIRDYLTRPEKGTVYNNESVLLIWTGGLASIIDSIRVQSPNEVAGSTRNSAEWMDLIVNVT